MYALSNVHSSISKAHKVPSISVSDGNHGLSTGQIQEALQYHISLKGPYATHLINVRFFSTKVHF